MKTNKEHLVLTGPKGKQSGIKDNKKIAIQMHAYELMNTNNGGGIVNLVLPNTEKEINKIKKYISKGYTTKRVESRNTIRKTLRENAQSDKLIVTLAVMFYEEKGESRRVRSAVINEFASWICEKLSDKKTTNSVIQFVESIDERLTKRTSPDWWKTQISQRVKKKKSELSFLILF